MRFKYSKSLTATACLLLLAGCGSVPRPFAHTQLAPPGPLADLVDGAGIQVRPLDGVPEKLANSLAEAFALSLRKSNIPATTASGFKAGYVLSGVVQAREDPPPGAPLAQLVWTLRDQAGKSIGSFEQTVKGDAKGWAEVDPKLIDVIAGGLTRPVAALIQDQRQPPARKPVRRLFIRPVILGSPAGVASPEQAIQLGNALRHAIGRAGLLVAETESSAGAVIEGSLQMGPETKGARRVSILWRALLPGGGEMGKIRQANRVAVEKIEREWGTIALAAAGGAVVGIKDLLARAPLAEKKPPLIQKKISRGLKTVYSGLTG
ncbi:MAG: hypothetical protein QGF09_06125, partial [Rhodospirillales bacterium]|nr:hypothetical protein [Rhodospirillales bacterium]